MPVQTLDCRTGIGTLGTTMSNIRVNWSRSLFVEPKTDFVHLGISQGFEEIFFEPPWILTNKVNPVRKRLVSHLLKGAGACKSLQAPFHPIDPGILVSVGSS